MEEDTKIKHVVSLVIDAALWERTKAAASSRSVIAHSLSRRASGWRPISETFGILRVRKVGMVVERRPPP